MARLNLGMLDEPAPGSVAIAPTGTPLMLPASSLVEDKNNPRTSFDQDKLAELAADIKARGILQPIIVRPAVDGKHAIMFGARRFRGGQMAGLLTFPCLVATDERQFDSYAQVAENNQREGLSLTNLAAFIQKRIAHGETKKDIAARLGVTAPTITYLCALIDPPKLLLEVYHAGKCTTAEYLYRLRNLHTKNPKLVERSAAAATEINREWLEELTTAVNGPKTKQQQKGGEPAALLTNAPAESSGARKPEPPDADPRKAKYRTIMVKHQDRPAQLVLNRRVSAVGLGWIKYADDGREVEIVLSTATIDSLIEG